MHFFTVQKPPSHLLWKKVKFNKTVGVQKENALVLSSPLEGMITHSGSDKSLKNAHLATKLTSWHIGFVAAVTPSAIISVYLEFPVISFCQL